MSTDEKMEASTDEQCVQCRREGWVMVAPCDGEWEYHCLACAHRWWGDDPEGSLAA